MSLTKKQVKQIAHLSRLSLTNDEVQNNTQELNAILHLIKQLSNINTDGIKPMAHPLDISQRLREDKVTEKNQVKLFHSIAPKTDKDYYLVPTVIE